MRGGIIVPHTRVKSRDEDKTDRQTGKDRIDGAIAGIKRQSNATKNGGAELLLCSFAFAVGSVGSSGCAGA